jgi:hypothetical protein
VTLLCRAVTHFFLRASFRTPLCHLTK